MKPKRWKEIDDLVQSALELEADERPTFLDSHCGGDPNLRREVESLIGYQEDASSFLESSMIENAAALMADAKVETLEGRTVSRYHLIRKIGEGGMGKVYLAEDAKLGRNVAIKFLPEGSAADEHARGRLVREAQAAAKLDHPNICAIHEVGEDAGRSFIVMQYVEGDTLAARMRDKPLDLSECLDIAAQVADALAEAHSHGIVHRDISPQNIMLTARHQVKVMDFGLAKVVRDRSLVDGEAVTESLLTEPGAIVGTVPYMSPEQLRGESPDARSDIFSLGVVLYEMVTGHQPFSAGSAAVTIWAILGTEPAPLARYTRGVPSELERIVCKALHKDREERYQATGDLLIDLRSLKHHLEFEQELECLLPPGASEGGKHPPVTTANEAADAGGLVATQAATAARLISAVKRHRLGAIIVAAATIVLAVGALIYLSYIGDKAIDSIAVLPLVNAGNDPETEYLSDGITESLINNLSKVQQLRKVVARTTAFRYKGKEIDPRQVGRELGVQAILTGKLIQRGDILAIQVEIVETSEGSQIWGDRYDKKASDLLAVQQELAREITERLRLRLSSEDEKRLTRGDAANTEAYQYYLRGRHFWNKATAEGMKKAREMFQQAINKDPNYALAYVGLADSYGVLELYTNIPSSETLPKARAAVERALQIDPLLAEAHASLGNLEMYSWNFDEAEREFRRAIELNPNYPTVHFFYGYYLRQIRGSYDEAIAEFRWAQRLDPLSPLIGQNIAAAHKCKGELSAAIEEAKKVIELDPNFPAAYFALGNAYREQGRYDEAIAALEKAVELSERWSISLGYLGVSYAVAGKRERARALLKELEEKYVSGEALGQSIAVVYAALGEKEKAFAWLEKDFQSRSGPLPFAAHDTVSDKTRDALGGDPRWDELRRRIGLPHD